MVNKYLVALRSFYDKEGIGVANFHCSNKIVCIEAAAPRPLYHGAEAHIGSRYGETTKAVVVSLDTGHEPADLQRRREIIEGLGTTDLNPHMQGTTELMRELFGEQVTKNSSLHSYYAMINAAKCSGADGVRDMINARLYHNCQPFSLSELRLLDPELIITQGKKAIEVLGSTNRVDNILLLDSLRSIQIQGQAAEWLSALGYEYLRVKELAGGFSSLVLQTPHPSARDGSWQRFTRIALKPVIFLVKQVVTARKNPIVGPR